MYDNRQLNRLLIIATGNNLEDYPIFKACVHYFYQIFIFSPNDRPSKTMKNVFYFI